MAAAGEYTQLGFGTDKLLRLDLKFPVGSKIGTMQEIRTRDYLWLIRDLPPDPPSLERVDLTWTRKNIARAQDEGRLGPLDGWMLLGGLSRLMTSLEGNFEFGDPKPATLADVPVVLLRGRWKQSAFDPTTKLSPPENLPASLPREVVVTLGDPEGRLPLFPYRIEFLRGEPGQEQGRAGGNDMSLATIEFFEVHPSASINPQQFEYDPEDRDVDDVTIPYLRKLGLGPAKSP